MKETIIKLQEIESMARKLQRRVLQEMISKATNGTIIDFLSDLLEDQIDTPSFTTLLDKIHELKFYTLKYRFEKSLTISLIQSHTISASDTIS